MTQFVKGVEDSDVFQIAFDISLEIHKASLQFPSIEQYALASYVSISKMLQSLRGKKIRSPITPEMSGCLEQSAWVQEGAK